MRVRLLLYVLLFVLEVAVVAGTAIEDKGLPGFPSVGLIPIVFAMVISELGRLNQGWVSRWWILGLSLTAAVAVVLGTIGLVQDSDAVDRVLGGFLLLLTTSVVPVVIVRSRRRRLGLARRSIVNNDRR